MNRFTVCLGEPFCQFSIAGQVQWQIKNNQGKPQHYRQEEKLNIVILGGSGGIGSAIVKKVNALFPHASVYATWHSQAPVDESIANWAQVDLLSQESIREFASRFDRVHWLVNAVGMLHTDQHMPEKSVRQVEADFFMRNVQLNALSTVLIARYFQPALKSGCSDGINVQFATVSAKVGSIEDNKLGGWYSYRCSKAALNMAIKNISIEWQRAIPSVCVTALHPGTTDTALSEPFQRNVPEGKLFTPEKVADCLVDLLSRLCAKDTGKFLAYDGEQLPW